MEINEMYRKGFISEERYELLKYESLKKEEIINSIRDNSTLVECINEAFDYVNLNSDDCDIIYKTIFRYEALRSLPKKTIGIIYNEIYRKMRG